MGACPERTTLHKPGGCHREEMCEVQNNLASLQCQPLNRIVTRSAFGYRLGREADPRIEKQTIGDGAMKFEERDGVWVLIDEAAPPDSCVCVIAVLKDEVEILARKQLCEQFLSNAGQSFQAFSIEYKGKKHKVALFPDRGNRLSMQIQGEDGSLRRVETQISFPGNDAPEGEVL